MYHLYIFCTDGNKWHFGNFGKYSKLLQYIFGFDNSVFNDISKFIYCPVYHHFRKITTVFSKKKLIEFGLICVIGSGILSFVGYQSLVILFVGAALLGVGVGFCASFAISLISDYYAPNQRGKLLEFKRQLVILEA